MPDFQKTLNLICHPATSAPTVGSLSVAVEFQGDDIVFHYCLRGDMARLRIPPEQVPARADLLWEHTCFELFVAREADTAYREFNFSPSGQWAVFDFDDYRRRKQDDPPVPAPMISTRLTDGRLEMNVVVPQTALYGESGETPLQIGISAVIEAADTVDGGHSYWALHHPSSRPDFHHRAGFSLNVSPRGPSVI